jgi:hypothetical protein
MFLAACSSTPESARQPSVTAIGVDKAVILDPSQADSMVRQCSRSAPEKHSGTWQVSEAVVAQLELDLPKLAQLTTDACCKRDGSVSAPEAYFRQYVGIVVDGKPLVYINAFKSNWSNAPWREKALVMCDGGDDYWGALYDPETRRFLALSINGEA